MRNPRALTTFPYSTFIKNFYHLINFIYFIENVSRAYQPLMFVGKDISAGSIG
jgi:hypothetical protein